MRRFLACFVFALFGLSSVAAMDFPVAATVSSDTALWEAASSQAAIIGRVHEGTEVTVSGCHDTWCAITAPELEGHVFGRNLILPNGNTVQQERATGIQPITRIAPNLIALRDIRLEGDSYMGGACKTAIAPMIQQASGRLVVNTARGGSTMDESRDRVLAAANRTLLPYVTVFWDGSQNGFTTATEYADILAESITALGHTRFIVIPAAIPTRLDNAVQAPQILAEFQSRWPENTLDWRDILQTTSTGALSPDHMCDTVHLNAASLQLMADAIASFVRAKGW